MESISDILKSERQQPWRDELRKSMKAKERTAIPRVKMPEQEPHVRNKNHKEVNMGLTDEKAMKEAQRCLDCVDPTCITGCPVGINIPKFIKRIEQGEFLESAKTLKETNALPAVCGRVCPQEAQCEANCFYVQKLKKDPVAIGFLERFAADYERNSGSISVPEVENRNGIKVAVIGSGPSGLAVAGDMIKWGYDVTVFEALHEIGGVLKYGIPEFRLPNEIVDVEIDNLKQMGVKFEINFIVGTTATVDDLKEEGFVAFFVGSGAGLPKFMNIPGENYRRIFSSNEYLTRVNLMNAANPEYDTPVFSGKNVAVIGGGNTAMDSVRTSKRLGADRSMIIYRRSIEEMPARVEEVKHAQEEDVEFMTLNSPVEYFAGENGNVNKMTVQKMELGEPDASGRRRPVPIAGSEFDLELNMIIPAIGQATDLSFLGNSSGIETTRRSNLVIDPETSTTTRPAIFAGGDAVTGPATAIEAIAWGKRAAVSIAKYLKRG